MERLFTGRTPPRNDEVARILAACGYVDADNIRPVEALLAGGVLLPARTAFGLLLNEHRADRHVDTRPCSLFVDYISFTFDAADSDKLCAITRAAGRPTKERRKRRRFYRFDYQCRSVTVQHGLANDDDDRAPRQKRRDSRIAFNPAKISYRAWPVVRRALSLATDIRVTRIDVAVDLPGRVQPITRRRKWRVFGAPGRVETFYVGAEGSDRQFRSYDKRRELIAHGLADEFHPELTRFEAQLRNPELATLSDLADLRDPFADADVELVTLVRAADLPFPLQLCANWADAFGAQALRPLVTPSEFAAVVKHLPTIDGTHPSRVFDAQWPSAASELLHNLGIT